jgi:sugar phosphate isomerase/epimerase
MIYKIYFSRSFKMQLDNKKSFGVFIWFGYRIPIPERIRLIKDTGFTAVLHWWDDSFFGIEGFTKEEQANIIRKEGLYIENAHLQFDEVNNLWMDTLHGQSVFENYLSDIEGLAKHEIPVAVLHPSSGINPPPISDIGMHRMRTLSERAEKHGVRIAVENVRNTHVLTYILDSIDSPALGLCYDSGHDFIWSPAPYELLKKYRDRIFAVHLHDNMGQNDDHLAPGMGRINWDVVRAGIENSVYCGAYTLESDSAKIPTSRTPQEHLAMHLENAIRVF